VNKQEIFDKVLLAILKQGRPSMVGRAMGAGCRYRQNISGKAADGACGIGHLIPDDMYKPKWDGHELNDTGFSVLVKQDPDFKLALQAGGVEISEEVPRDFLQELQGAHDDAAMREAIFMPAFKRRMKLLAGRWDLNYIEVA
jgi:hypothetical protein